VHSAVMVAVDETDWREGKQQAWLWTAVTPALTVFVVDRGARERGAGGALGGGICRHCGIPPLVSVCSISGGAKGAVLRPPEAGFPSVGGPRRRGGADCPLGVGRNGPALCPLALDPCGRIRPLRVAVPAGATVGPAGAVGVARRSQSGR
jgi:hypothetical protein